MHVSDLHCTNVQFYFIWLSCLILPIFDLNSHIFVFLWSECMFWMGFDMDHTVRVSRENTYFHRGKVCEQEWVVIFWGEGVLPLILQQRSVWSVGHRVFPTFCSRVRYLTKRLWHLVWLSFSVILSPLSSATVCPFHQHSVHDEVSWKWMHHGYSY